MLHNKLLQKITSYGEEVLLSKGDFLIKEGEKSTEFFLIEEGQIEILKTAKGAKGEHQIAILKQGELVGELALVDDKPRSASAKVVKSARLLRFNIKTLDESLRSELVRALALDLSQRLRHTSEGNVMALEKKLYETQARNLLGSLFTRVLIILGVYTLLFRILITKTTDTQQVFLAMMAILTVATLQLVKQTGYPLKDFGFTLKNWKKSVVEGVIFTIPMLLFAVLLKWTLIKVTGVEQPLIDPLMNHVPLKDALVVALVYAGLAVVQELVARGVVQTLMARLIKSERKTNWTAIVLANLLFTALHTYIGIGFTCIVFFPGFYFGWLYERQKNLVGVSVAHALVGIWGLEIVNVLPLLDWG